MSLPLPDVILYRIVFDTNDCNDCLPACRPNKAWLNHCPNHSYVLYWDQGSACGGGHYMKKVVTMCFFLHASHGVTCKAGLELKVCF